MKKSIIPQLTAALLTSAVAIFSLSTDAFADMLDVEKDELRLGFIKLTDMAPLAIAYEKGYFEDEGLFVTLEPQANWKVLLDRTITGELDGAHMLAGQPLAATIGFGTKAHIVTPFSMDLNGNGITVSNEVWEMMKPHLEYGDDGKPVHPISAAALKPVIEQFKTDGKSFNMGMVFPVSTHNYELRYWLAAGGIHPGFYSPSDTSGQIDAEALLSVTPPPQMPSTLEAGTINEEEAKTHRYRNVLYRYLGTKDGASGTEAVEIRPSSGDRFFLCSDGVTDGIDDATIQKLLAASDDPQQIAESMIAAAQEGGSRDNITGLVVIID